MNELVPGAVSWHSRITTPRWRAVLDRIEDKGLYKSGVREWRCAHAHRSVKAAEDCARRALRTQSTGSKDGGPA